MMKHQHSALDSLQGAWGEEAVTSACDGWHCSGSATLHCATVPSTLTVHAFLCCLSGKTSPPSKVVSNNLHLSSCQLACPHMKPTPASSLAAATDTVTSQR
jgi:hypothetical protein